MDFSPVKIGEMRWKIICVMSLRQNSKYVRQFSYSYFDRLRRSTRGYQKHEFYFNLIYIRTWFTYLVKIKFSFHMLVSWTIFSRQCRFDRNKIPSYNNVPFDKWILSRLLFFKLSWIFIKSVCAFQLFFLWMKILIKRLHFYFYLFFLLFFFYFLFFAWNSGMRSYNYF